MGRASLPLAAMAAALLLALGGCGGDSGSFSNDEIQKALDLDGSSNSYEVGGDPFCKVSDLLNDADEVEGIGRADRSLAITSREGGVGVVVKPPFPPDCQQRVQAGLNDLDPPPGKEGKGKGGGGAARSAGVSRPAASSRTLGAWPRSASRG